MAEAWASVEDVAPYLGVVKCTIYGRNEMRSFSAYRVGLLHKLKLSEVDGRVRAGNAVDKSEGPEAKR